MKLNKQAYEFAKKLLENGKYIKSESWEKPTAAVENQYIKTHGYEAYSNWYLGIRMEDNPETKNAYAFEFTNDFEHLDLTSLHAIDSRAGQNHYTDILEAGESLRKLAQDLGYF